MKAANVCGRVWWHCLAKLLSFPCFGTYFHLIAAVQHRFDWMEVERMAIAPFVSKILAGHYMHAHLRVNPKSNLRCSHLQGKLTRLFELFDCTLSCSPWFHFFKHVLSEELKAINHYKPTDSLIPLDLFSKWHKRTSKQQFHYQWVRSIHQQIHIQNEKAICNFSNGTCYFVTKLYLWQFLYFILPIAINDTRFASVFFNWLAFVINFKKCFTICNVVKFLIQTVDWHLSVSVSFTSITIHCFCLRHCIICPVD